VPLSLAVHGGAWNLPDEAVRPTLDGVRAAVELGWRALTEGRSAVDVVELVVRHLEDDPTFDAGVGSRLNRDGKVEMDASIMEGDDLGAGAVAALQCVRNPISVARLVMTGTPHVMLVGEGARRFAEQSGVPMCDTSDLLVGRERERYERVRAGEVHLVDSEFGEPERPMGTVGAVALDRRGCIASATSTGGTQDKLPGRVGDTPVIGAGVYADSLAGGASATGWGEGILRVVLCKTAVDSMRSGAAPADAGARALETLTRVRGRGGLILVDRLGRAAAVFNTPRMARGWATEKEGPQVEVDPASR
jgi:beta-aspartyl-peptidase (threonine type)